MRIVICVKQIRHTYARTGMDPERAFLSPEDRVHIVNPYDEAALGIALDIKALREDVNISLLTLGPIIAEDELRRCLALGADDLIQVDVGDGLDSWAKSVVLAKAIGAMEAGVILCGKESLDTQSGQVGAYMAHYLRLPFLSAVTDVRINPGGGARVERAGGRGVREIVECPLPAVFSVDLAVLKTRLPPYESRKRARTAPIRKIVFPEVLPKNKVIFSGAYPPRPRPKKVPAPDSRQEAYFRIEQLLSGSRIQKKGLILDGDAKSQAEGIVSFLEEHGFLKPEKPEKKE